MPTFLCFSTISSAVTPANAAPVHAIDDDDVAVAGVTMVGGASHRRRRRNCCRSHHGRYACLPSRSKTYHRRSSPLRILHSPWFIPFMGEGRDWRSSGAGCGGPHAKGNWWRRTGGAPRQGGWAWVFFLRRWMNGRLGIRICFALGDKAASLRPSCVSRDKACGRQRCGRALAATTSTLVC
jgi:hypothetical protein